MARRLENLLAFQIGWLGCVSSAARDLPLLGLLIASLVAALHLWRSEKPSSELKLIASAIALGAVADSLLLATGWLSYAAGQPLAWLAPYWIIAMWAMFATTLNESLAWLKTRPLLAGAAGALLAPLAYWAGARIGAIRLDDPDAALIAIGAAWAVALPALNGFARAFSSPPSASEGAVANDQLAGHA